MNFNCYLVVEIKINQAFSIMKKSTHFKINATTKISKLIEMNPEAIDVIASIKKQFRKLQNPILRRTLASRVTIKDAAKIGNVSVDVFMQKLAEIGFDVEVNKSDGKTLLDTKCPKVGEIQNENIILKDMKVIELDVRPGLEKGIDPFQIIMKEIKTLEDGEVLRVINTFEPLPLINVLKNKGYRSWTERQDNLVLTYFQKTEESVTKGLEHSQNLSNSNFEETMARFAGKLIDVDVRGLEMPEPMMIILEKIEDIPEGHALYVHHERIPQYLKPELHNRGIELLIYEEENGVKLLIYK
jgi:uncharacterized protein (DUF2249 family)